MLLMMLNYVDVVVEERGMLARVGPNSRVAPLLDMIRSELDAISSNPSLDVLL